MVVPLVVVVGGAIVVFEEVEVVLKRLDAVDVIVVVTFFVVVVGAVVVVTTSGNGELAPKTINKAIEFTAIMTYKNALKWSVKCRGVLDRWKINFADR